MKIPILSKLFKSRASPKNTFWQNAYAFFFGPTPSGKTVNGLPCGVPLLTWRTPQPVWPKLLMI